VKVGDNGCTNKYEQSSNKKVYVWRNFIKNKTKEDNEESVHDLDD